MRIYAITSRESLPLSIQIGPSNKHNSKHFIKLLEDLRVKHSKNRPKTKPKEVTGNSAYDTKKIRIYLKCRGIKANIDFNQRSKPKRGRPYGFDRKTYRSMRSVVERFFAWLKAFRRINIRYERLASTLPSTHTSSMHNNIPEGFAMSSLLNSLSTIL